MITNSHNILLHRTFQWMAIISVLAVLGGGYWYWKNARAAVEIGDNRPSFEAPLTHDLNLTRGQGPATHSRSDGADRRATVTDFEGLIRPVKNGETRFEGARRVENLVTTTSEDFSNAAWSNTSVSLSSEISDPNGGTGAMRMTATGANGFISKSTGGTIGRIYTHSIWIRRISGSGSVILHGNTVGETTITAQVTTSWKRFSNTFTETDGNAYAGVRLGTSGDVIDIAFVQMEEVTGQADQSPSEYVSVGVKTSAPYHGAGVDGVKYFDTENGNTVASNVVTEATGTAIPTTTLKGYLAEGARTNLALRSEECDNASWAKTSATISANATTGPDGRTTADKIVEDAVTAQHKCAQNISTTAGSTLTFSVYAKKAERHLGVHLWNATDLTFGKAEVNLDTGSVISSTGTVYVEDLPGSWYRIIITATPTVASSSYILMPNDGSSSNYAGDGTSGVYVWGMQLEQASFASSYIPTTSASVSRGTDTLSYQASGNIDLSKGSFYVESFGRYNISGQGSSAAVMISHETAALTNTITLFGSFASTAGSRAQVRNGTSAQADVSTGSGALGASHKHAMRWASNAVQAYFDGSAGTQDTVAVMPSTSGTLYIGNWLNNAPAWGNVRNVRSWKKALTDTELNNLTSLTQATSESATKKTTVKAPDNTGLVSYWSFEDGSGTKAEDFSASGTNTGTLTNMESGDWVDGKFGKALAFDGVNEYVNVPNATSLNPGTGNFTISAWIRVDSAPSDYRRLINKGAGANYYAFVKFPGDKWKFEFRDGTLSTGDLDFGASTMTYGNWTHLVATVDQGNALTSGYLDGVLKDTSSIAGYATVSNTDYLSLGRSSIDAPYVIDDVRIYDRSLSASEVADLYRSGSATKLNASQNSQLTNGLVGLWSFNGPDISGTTAYDRSGSGNNGTLTNGPAATIGKVGQALSFDGTNDYISLGNVDIIDGASAASVCLWMKYNPSSVTADGAIVSKWTAAGGGWLMWVDDSDSLGSGKINTISFSIDSAISAPGRVVGTSGLVTSGAWDHYCGTFQGGSFIRLYKNGVLNSENTTNIAATVKTTTTPIYTANSADSSAIKYLNSSLDEMRIYDRALTAEEITALYNAGR